MLECNEFVNADEIARGLSPFKPEKAAIQAGRLMLDKINKLIETGQDFAFEISHIPNLKPQADIECSMFFDEVCPIDQNEIGVDVQM